MKRDDNDDNFIPPLEEMNKSRTKVRQFLVSHKIFYQEFEYDYYSRFRLHNSPYVINLLAYECEPQVSGDVFVNKPMFDILFKAQGSTRIGVTNTNNDDFFKELSKLLRLGDDSSS